MVSFPALPELVEDRVNGRVFQDSEELAVIIRDWFMDWPREQREHAEYRENLDRFRALDWATNWDKEALWVARARRALSALRRRRHLADPAPAAEDTR